MPLDNQLTATSVSTPHEPPRSLDRCGVSCLRRPTAWFVAWTIPRREAAAAKAIRALPFAKAMLPMLRTRTICRHTVITPLWPGYVLASFDPDRDPWGQLTRIPEVAGIICHAPGRPTPLPDNTVPDLIASLSPAGYVEHAICGASDEAGGRSKPEWLPMVQMDAGSRVALLYRLFGQRAAQRHLEAA